MALNSPIIYCPSILYSSYQNKQVNLQGYQQTTQPQTSLQTAPTLPQSQITYIRRVKQASSPHHDIFLIHYKTLPFIFDFSYPALQRIRLHRDQQTPKIAVSIFDFLIQKLVVKRYSQGSSYPNRMKYQQKVKYLIRAFGHSRNPSIAVRIPQKFNKQQQLQFFSSEQTRIHFIAQTRKALKEKKAQNQHRKRQMRQYIQLALKLWGEKKYRQAQGCLQCRIKRKQLPWTDNMFRDMQEFSHQLYYRCMEEIQQLGGSVNSSSVYSKGNVNGINLSSRSMNGMSGNPTNSDHYVNFITYTAVSQQQSFTLYKHINLLFESLHTILKSSQMQRKLSKQIKKMLFLIKNSQFLFSSQKIQKSTLSQFLRQQFQPVINLDTMSDDRRVSVQIDYLKKHPHLKKVQQIGPRLIKMLYDPWNIRSPLAQQTYRIKSRKVSMQLAQQDNYNIQNRSSRLRNNNSPRIQDNCSSRIPSPLKRTKVQKCKNVIDEQSMQFIQNNSLLKSIGKSITPTIIIKLTLGDTSMQIPHIPKLRRFESDAHRQLITSKGIQNMSHQFQNINKMLDLFWRSIFNISRKEIILRMFI